MRTGPFRIASVVVLDFCLAATTESGLPSKYKAVPDFKVPKEFRTVQDFHPVGYLEAYPVANEKVKLPPASREDLRKLFIAAHEATKEKYQQDYLIDIECPIVRLLRSNYPEIEELLRNRPQVMFLGTIAGRLRELSASPSSKPPTSR